MSERLFWIDVTYACFGMAAMDGRVVAVAPIAAWMQGKTLNEIRPWLRRKRAIVKEVTTNHVSE